MAYSPMAGGILTGKYQFDVFPKGSRWAFWKNSRGLPSYWTKKNFAAIDELKKIACSIDISVAALAIAWVHQFEGIGTTLLGPKHEGHLGPIKKAQKANLPSDVVDNMTSLFQEKR